MSYILDALKRAESERAAQQGDTLSARAEGSRTRRLPLSTLLLINLTVFLAGGALVAWLTGALDRPAPVTSTATPATPAPSATPTPAPTPVPVLPVLEALPAEPEPAPTEDDEDLAAQLAAYETLDDILPPKPKPQPQSSATPATSAAQTPAIAVATSAPQTSTAPTASETPPQAALAPGLRRLSDMPAAYRSAFPKPDIQVHVYDADPAKRWVMIDDKRYGEGSALDNGSTLVSIEPAGIVFEFRGEQILWVLNL